MGKAIKSPVKASYSYQSVLSWRYSRMRPQVIWRSSSTVGRYLSPHLARWSTVSSVAWSSWSTWSSQLLLIQTSEIRRKMYHLYGLIKQEPTDADILSEPAVFVFDVAKEHEHIAPCQLTEHWWVLLLACDWTKLLGNCSSAVTNIPVFRLRIEHNSQVTPWGRLLKFLLSKATYLKRHLLSTNMTL